MTKSSQVPATSMVGTCTRPLEFAPAGAGVLAAAALKCVGGQFQGRLVFRNDDEKARAERTGHGEHSRPGVRPRTRHHADDASGVLVRGGPRDGQEAADVVVPQASDRGGATVTRGFQVHELEPTGGAVRGWQQQAGLHGSEGHGAVGPQHGPDHAPVVHPDAARHVHGDHGRDLEVRTRPARPCAVEVAVEVTLPPCLVHELTQQLDQQSGRAAQPTPSADAEQSVEHHVGGERQQRSPKRNSQKHNDREDISNRSGGSCWSRRLFFVDRKSRLRFCRRCARVRQFLSERSVPGQGTEPRARG